MYTPTDDNMDNINTQNLLVCKYNRNSNRNHYRAKFWHKIIQTLIVTTGQQSLSRMVLDTAKIKSMYLLINTLGIIKIFNYS